MECIVYDALSWTRLHFEWLNRSTGSPSLSLSLSLAWAVNRKITAKEVVTEYLSTFTADSNFPLLGNQC